MAPVQALCLHQPDPTTSAGIELCLPPRQHHDDPYSPLWKFLSSSVHLTSLSILGSFALLLPPTVPQPSTTGPHEPQLTSKPKPQPTNATNLDLDYFFGDTPGPEATSEPPADNTQPPTTPQAATPNTSKPPPPQSIHNNYPPHQSPPAASYPREPAFSAALTALSPLLRSLTLQNAPLSDALCATIERLTLLTHLDISASEKVYAVAGGRMESVRRPDCEAWAKWRFQGSTHQTQRVTLPDALRHCTALALSRLPHLQQLSVRGQQGLPWAAIESLTDLRALTALDVAHCIDMPNTALYQVCCRKRCRE